MINNVVLMGRLVADPDFRTTTTGIETCSFRLAVDRDFASQDGTRQADFIPCVAWRGTANFINRFFTKGQMIAITGRLQTRSYEDSNGMKRNAFDIVVDSASFCGSKAESGGRVADSYGAAPAKSEPAPAISNAKPSDFEVIAPDDSEDLPF